VRPTGEWLNQPGGLAERLVRLRRGAGLTGDALAKQLGWPRSKVPKLENGRQLPTEADLTAWAQATGQPEAAAELLDMLAEARVVHRQYRHRLRRGHAAIQEELDELVRGAKRIRNVEVLFIPGLLQTPDYARYRMAEAVRNYGFAEDGVEAAVAARMRRQEALYDSDREFEFIIMEVALRVRVCPAEVMSGQLDRLLVATGLAGVTLAIIPLDAELTVAPDMGFLIADDVAYIETPTSEDLVRGEEAVTYGRLADGLRAEAVTGDAARELITAAARALASG
jgi:transcriptional regulator with XRE-family HTH domain